MRGAAFKGGLGAGGFEDHQVSAVTVHIERGGQAGDREQVTAGVGDLVHQLAGLSIWCESSCFLGQPLLAETFRVGFKSQVALHDHHPLAGVADAVDFNREGKAVEQLRAQVAFFGVHRAHQDEARRVGEGNALALDDVHAHGGRIEQHVHHVVVQQVNFVDIEQPAVGRRQHAGLKMALAFLDGFFDIQRAHHAVFGGGNRQVDERSRALPVGSGSPRASAFAALGAPE